MTLVNESSLIRISKVSSVIPALETSTSTRPNCSSTSANARSTDSVSVTSHWTPGSPSGAPLPRWVITTWSPAAWNAVAMASPMPRLPPVTNTTRLTRATLADAGSRSALPAGRVGAMRAVQISQFGGPEVLEVVELPDPEPGPNQVVATVRAAGINYADTHAIENSYLAQQKLPLIPGGEVLVELPDGERALGMAEAGGYAQKVAVNPKRLIGVPDGISDGQALTCLVQGASAWHLLRTSAHLGRRRVGGRACRRRWRRHHRDPAGQAVGCGSGHRDRIVAETSASLPLTSAPTSPWIPAPKT